MPVAFPRLGAIAEPECCLAVVSRLVLWVLATILLPTQKVYVGPGTSMHWVGAFAADVCPWSSISLAAFLVGLAFAAFALCWKSGGLDVLCLTVCIEREDQVRLNTRLSASGVGLVVLLYSLLCLNLVCNCLKTWLLALQAYC